MSKPSHTEQKQLVPFWKVIFKRLLTLLGVVSILIAIAEGYPWLSIQEGPLLDPANPYSELFSISNGGYIPVTDLTARCYPTMNTPSWKTDHDTYMIRNFSKSLSHGDFITVPCFRAVSGMRDVAKGSKLDVDIEYAIFHLNFSILRRTQSFHFRIETGPDGVAHWIFVT